MDTRSELLMHQISSIQERKAREGNAASKDWIINQQWCNQAINGKWVDQPSCNLGKRVLKKRRLQDGQRTNMRCEEVSMKHGKLMHNHFFCSDRVHHDATSIKNWPVLTGSWWQLIGSQPLSGDVGHFEKLHTYELKHRFLCSLECIANSATIWRLSILRARKSMMKNSSWIKKCPTTIWKWLIGKYLSTLLSCVLGSRYDPYDYPRGVASLDLAASALT